MTLLLTTNAERFLRRFDQLPKATQTGVMTGLRRGLLLLETKVQVNSRLKSRRGSAGLFGRLTSYAGPYREVGVDGAIGFRRTRGFPYELAQEFGAKAKPGKAMAVPLTPEAKAAGSPRDYPGELVIVKYRGKALMAEKGRRASLDPQYILLKRIKPKLDFRKNVFAGLGMLSNQIVNSVLAAYKRV